MQRFVHLFLFPPVREEEVFVGDDHTGIDDLDLVFDHRDGIIDIDGTINKIMCEAEIECEVVKFRMGR